VKYVDKYPHPGKRPEDPGPHPAGGMADGVEFDAWNRHRVAKEVDDTWCLRMRQHLVAKGLDACFAVGEVLTGKYDGAFAAMALAFLGEPWPREVFP